MACLIRNIQKIGSTNSCGEERLVGVTPSCVHNQTTLVGANGFGKSLWALLNKNVSPSRLARDGCINDLTLGGLEGGHNDIATEFWLSNLALDTASVNSQVSQVSQKLLGTILTANKVE
jgi:hypothetical protein